ncbi:MAG: hypothetical protein A2015_11800 [Spirochaetes bacterium GWF1_31_7]|nr:MAG: hypothetical protein A2Y30_15275 [Spirochaetes bacterium GWE1_32_154]OHD49102.1 MAG: hypothetical protein A2015_11800 [Spirochaetes bacterium GWF1_31_7]OHD50312.1 MAG: hypothetical protein A2Y29_13325 [Spirochaetes bacterium GWE2_31_10]HBD93900.1 hypothetical protein [Spirochaetia bacterium]HBI38792.1 hypothetical protein [Spirochaetia bacterium]
MAKKATGTESVIETEIKKTTKTSKVKNLSDLFGEIEKKSYEIFLARQASGLSGSDIDDWSQAEKEIKEKHGIK